MSDVSYEIHPYSSRWPAQFEEERVRLQVIFGADAKSITHVGSTSVPGLSAKPIIDIVIETDNLLAIDVHVQEMVRNGYRAEGARITSDSRFFRKRGEGDMQYNIHVFPVGHSETRMMIMLRDYLRAHSEEVVCYEAEKHALQEKYPADYIAYREGKRDFVEELKKRARTWSQQLL